MKIRSYVPSIARTRTHCPALTDKIRSDPERGPAGSAGRLGVVAGAGRPEKLPSSQVTRHVFVVKAAADGHRSTDLWINLQILSTNYTHPSLQTGPDGLD